jgi:negative regulator of sigma E activity
MKKQKETTVQNTIDSHKPIIKDYVDSDSQAIEFVRLCATYVKNSIVKVVNISKTKDGKSGRYRINWIDTEKNLISQTRYLQLDSTVDGFKITYLD